MLKTESRALNQESILAHVTMEQMNPKSGAIYQNTHEIVERLASALARGAKLVVLPELAVTGYCVSDLVEDQDFLQANKEALKHIAQATKGLIAVVGFVDFDTSKTQEDGSIAKYNAAAIFCDGKLVDIVHKRLLPNYRYFDDKRFFSKGAESKPIELTLCGESIKLGVAICEDIWDEHYRDKPVQELCKKGAELIVCLNASPTFPGKIEVRDQLIRAHIENSHVPIVYTNTVGAADIGKTIVCFDGESLAYNAGGKLVAKGKKFVAESIDVNLTTDNEIKLPQTKREQHLYDGLVMALKDYAAKTGFKKAIVPVSGGIDSALGLALAVDAFGPANVVAYNLPSKFNTDTTKGIARELADNFAVEYKVIPIQEIDEQIRKEIETHSHTIKNGVTKENLHARIRGMLVMAESNDLGSLLISCGNKTEVALGYSTLYGDMCGGISVIGDLSKSDVYAVSRYVNERAGSSLIPESTFNIKPSAELSEGQYDPFDYSVASPLVDAFIIERKSPAALVRDFEAKRIDWPADPEGKTVYDKHSKETFAELAQRLYKLFRGSVYKRLQGPPIPSLTERTFGFDLREPLINGWSGAE